MMLLYVCSQYTVLYNTHTHIYIYKYISRCSQHGNLYYGKICGILLYFLFFVNMKWFYNSEAQTVWLKDAIVVLYNLSLSATCCRHSPQIRLLTTF